MPDLFEVIHSTRSMRRLKPDPVPPAALRKILAAGTQAASGQNTQPWSFLVLRDPQAKLFVAEHYRVVMEKHFAARLPASDDHSKGARSMRAAWYLAQHLHETPVLLLVCGLRDWPFSVPESRRVGKAPPSYGSIYPCIQNILLACRALGLGATLTTLHQLFEEELAQHFSIPDSYGVVSMIPIGYPMGKFGPLSRVPADRLTYFDRWGNSEVPKSS